MAFPAGIRPFAPATTDLVGRDDSARPAIL